MAYVIVTPRSRSTDSYSEAEACWSPAVDIMERDASYSITIDLPGFEREDIKITVQEDVLTVSADRMRREPEKEEFFRYFERPTGKISRSFRLPETVNREDVKATYHNGALTLELLKKEESKPHAIQIGEG